MGQIQFLGQEIGLKKFTLRLRPRKSGQWFFVQDQENLIFFMLEIRPRQDLTQDSGQDRDDIESFSVFFLREPR